MALTQKEKAEGRKRQKELLARQEGGQVRILASSTACDKHFARLEADLSFRATSTASKESAAHNLAVRYFLGSAWRAQLGEAVNKVSVEPGLNGLFIGRFNR